MVGGGGVAHLADLAVEAAVLEGIDPEVHALADVHGADVGLGDGELDLHLGEVVGDGEEGGGVEGGGDGLAGIHVADDHDAVDGGVDGGALEVHAGAFDGGLAHLDVGGGLLDLDVVLGELGLGDELGLVELAGALEVEQREGLLGLGRRQVGIGSRKGALKRGRIDLGEDVARLHPGVKVGENLGDGAGDLRPDLDEADGGELSVGVDGLDHVGPADGLGLQLDGGGLLELAATCGEEGGDEPRARGHRGGAQGGAARERGAGHGESRLGHCERRCHPCRAVSS